MLSLEPNREKNHWLNIPWRLARGSWREPFGSWNGTNIKVSQHVQALDLAHFDDFARALDDDLRPRPAMVQDYDVVLGGLVFDGLTSRWILNIFPPCHVAMPFGGSTLMLAR